MLLGFVSGLAVIAAVAAILLVFGFEHGSASAQTLRRQLLQSIRNPRNPQNPAAILRTARFVPWAMVVAGFFLATVSSLNALAGFSYFTAALGGSMIAHAISARNIFAALIQEGAVHE
jgi:hypothetical protein